MEVQLAYDHRTQVLTTASHSALDFAANLRRLPVAFHGLVNEPYLMRQMMVALQDVILGDYTWQGQAWVLDPVITVHPDKLFFEAFSRDESAYAQLGVSSDAFDLLGETTYGTTNIDFTFLLREAMLDMRSSRQTTFSVGAGGLGVSTQTDEADSTRAHYEPKVDLPDSWIKGFLQVQAALLMKAFTFEVRPAQFLSVINFMLEHPAKRPPNGMRYQFAPGEPVRVILEPWEQEFTFHGAIVESYERTVRVWGRKRLELLQRVLPYADSVTIGVIGRGLPHFYICHCGAYDFLLLLSGWVENDWSKGGAFETLAQSAADPEQVATVYNVLAQQLVMSFGALKDHTLLDSRTLEAALLRLCQMGRVIYDPVSHRYRSRELFAEPINAEQMFAPPPQLRRAHELQSHVTIDAVFPSDTRPHEIKTLAHVRDEVQHKDYDVLVAVDRDLRIRFAQCGCAYFREHIMSRGPCEHILAARLAAEARLQEMVSARETLS